LKDDDAVISCVMFASAARKVGFRPENGLEVVAVGRVEHFPRQGRTQLYVEALEPVGAGALELRFRALCNEIRALGWFDDARKRPIPLFPRRIAVVTSRTGAALQDVLDTMRRRCPAVEILLVDVRVQGESAAPQIARAINHLSAHSESLGLDALLVTRGGGSMEDLWAFNERIVAESIVRSRIPVVAAIGHETDTTIAELVADLRAATPTQAAMRLAPDSAALNEQLNQYAGRLAYTLTRRLQHDREVLRGIARSRVFADPLWSILRFREHTQSRAHRLHTAAARRLHAASLRIERLASRLAARRPEAVYAARRSTLHELEGRLSRAVGARLAAFDTDDAHKRLTRAWRIASASRAQRLEALNRALAIAGPDSVLRRGYSITLRDDGVVVRAPSDVRDGDLIRTRLAEGDFASRVESDQPAPRPRRRSRSAEPPPETPPTTDQPTLFPPND
ncbi:MAG: exodeoxyribonuclease VII large subunit, partial [Planctomycetota bacterium]|nr:exodeoxyribonuclease VII large subunit [Planctomycetota bacterium]